MASRQAIEAALQRADTRLDQLRVLMQTYEHDSLLDDNGKWSVRDCLSHIAATAQVSAAGQRALQRLSGEASPPAPGGPSVDERNAQQVNERTAKSIAELIDETKQGHALAAADLQGMNDATLDTKVPDMMANRPSLSVGGIILRTLEYHESGQLDRIESALRAHTRWA